MACRGSGVRVPVAPPTATRRPSPHPSPARRGVIRLRGPDVTETTETSDPTEARTRIERYDPTAIEPRWQARWAELELYETDLVDDSATQVLPADDVPVSVGRPAHRPLVHRHPDRRAGPLPTDARLQRVLPDRLRCVRPAGRERRDQERQPSVHLDDAEHRATMRPPVPDDGRDVRLDARDRHLPIPAFYRWNQWLFLRFLEAGLAYRRMSSVDWCPNDGTLAREQVEGADRHCWRCGALVEKRDLEQWFLRTTAYADELLDFTGIDWPEPIRIHADELDRPIRRRRDRLRGRARRPPTGRRPPARVHDPAGHAVRGDVHGPRAGASAGRDADPARPARRGRTRTSSRPAGGPRSTGSRPIGEKTGVHSAPTPSTRSTANGSRSWSPTTCWPATAPARSWPCPPTTSATSSSPPGSGSRSGGSSPRRASTSPMPARERLHRARRGEQLVNSGPLSGMAADEGGKAIVAEAGGDAAGPSPRSPTGCATGWSAGSATGARPSRSSTARTDGVVPVPYERAAGPLAGDGRLRGQRRQSAQPRRGLPARRLPDLRRAGPARDRHHGHLRGFVVVLVPLPVAATSTAVRSIAR